MVVFELCVSVTLQSEDYFEEIKAIMKDNA